MGKSLLIGAAACGLLSCILVIVALISSAWITGCIPYVNIFKAISGNPEVQENLPANYEEGAKFLDGTELCLHLGLFKVNMKVANLLDMSISVDIFSIPRVVMFGVVALTIAVIFGAIGAVLLMAVAARNKASYEEKGASIKRCERAMILLVLAGFAGIFGMGAYTGGTAHIASDPLIFLANFGLAAGSSLQNNLMRGQFSDVRGKRDLTDGLAPEMQQYIHTMTEDLHPSYGYAYAIGWISVVVMIIAAALAAVAKQRLIHRPYYGPSSVKIEHE